MGKPTITGEWNLPLYVVGSTIVLTVVMTAQWYDLRQRVDNSVTTQQAQEWIDNAREQNPTVRWPRLPAKQAQGIITREAVLTRKD